jgi:diguanylate cyclase (GGDEF)-like protein
VLDITLPDASGLDVLEALQSADRTSWIPVVVVSGDTTPVATTRALHSGAQDFITKPFTNEELQARLTAALRVARTHRALSDAQQLLLHQSLHDPLTGLPNRTLLFDRLRQAQAQQARHRRGLAVLFLDLDRLKAVNDELGHEAGDSLLVRIADRLREVVREGDTVARLGGDEFVVVAEAIGDTDAALELAERIRAALAQPYLVAGVDVVCTASIGVAQPRAGQLPQEILREADRAMYRAKDLGKNRWVLVDESLWDREGGQRGPLDRLW